MLHVMWTELNIFLKSHLRRFHSLLKKILAPWMNSQTGFPPVLKRVSGSLFWLHPRFLTERTRDIQPLVFHWITRFLRPGDIFFDVGAHCGWMALKAARCVGAKGKVVAFEPAPVLFTLARYHQKINRLHQLIIIPQAVSNQDSDGALFYVLNDGMSFRNSLTIGSENVPYVSPGEKKALKVPATTLDTFFSNTGLIPTLIKIDVEGAEMLVLEGAQQLIERYHPALIVAIHPYWLPAHQSADQLFTFLSRYGYSCKESHIVWMDDIPVGDYLFSTRRDQG